MRERIETSLPVTDAVLAVGLQMAVYLSSVPPAIPTVLDNYNVESAILARLAATRPFPKRLYWFFEASKLMRRERALLRAAGRVFAISEADAASMRSLQPSARVQTVPMAIDMEYFCSDEEPCPVSPARFAFIGVFNWHVNEDAAVWLCEEIWPRVRAAIPDAQLDLVGRDPSPRVRLLARDPSVRVTGTVPDVRPHLSKSTAVLVPLRYGSGVRTKILEAFAAGRPVISTRVGCEGLDVRHGEHLMIADTEEAFAELCIRLHEDANIGRELVRSARAVVAAQEEQATEKLHRALAEAFPNIYPLAVEPTGENADPFHYRQVPT